MIKNLILIAFIFFGIIANAQISKSEVLQDVSVFPQETVQLYVNSKLLLAGELLQYKAFGLTTSNKKSALSKILYISLRTASDSVVFNHKLNIENGTVNGDFFIPSNLKSGIYKLIGYTNFSKNNQQQAFAQEDIFIINTFIKSEGAESGKETVVINSSSEKKFENSENTNSSESLKIKLNNQTFGFREKVILNLESQENGDNGSYLLSVRKINPVEILGEVAKATKVISPEVFYLPELRGELISGVVHSKLTETPVANIEVALTIPGAAYIFKIAKTNAQGRFFFSVDESYDSEKSIVQLYGDEAARSANKLVLDNKDLKLSEGTYHKLKLQPQLKDWLQERSVQLQIENAYFDLKKDSILKNKSNTAFYDALGTVYLLDDYTRFPTVRETFVEVVTLAAIRGSGADTRFLVNNSYDPNRIAKFNAIDPLVLLDGMLIQDNSELLNYNARELESIRVVMQPYRFGSKIFSGIIAVETKKGDFIPNLALESIEEIFLPPVVKKTKAFRPNYNENLQLSRIPDYRVQLLWEPKIVLSEAGTTVSFYTSDVSGVFEISIIGFTADGRHISQKSYFTVLE